MSRRSLRGALVLGAVLAPWGIAAQQTEADLLRHLDSIRPLAAAARVEAQAVFDALDEKANADADVVRVDTFNVGPLRIIAPSNQRQVAEDIYATAWADFAPFIDELPIAADYYLTFAWPLVDGGMALRGRVIRLEVPRWRTRGMVEQRARQAIGTLLAREINGARLGGWLTAEIHAPWNPGDTYRTLALTQGASVRECMAGDAAMCWMILGADLDQAEYPMTEWYTPQERQAQVRPREHLGRLEGPFADLYHRCLANDYESCDAVIREMNLNDNWDSAAPTYSGGTRGSVVWLALTLGGPGAWDRLRAHKDDSPGNALRAASGLEAGPLAARWLEWVQADRPAPRRALDPGYLFALGWLVLFVAFAMRSKRCRLG